VSVRVPNVQMSFAVSADVDDAIKEIFESRFVVTCLPIVPAVVSVLVATFQTSAARVPNVVSERVPFAQTAVGIVEASEVDAFSTVAFVLVLIVVTEFEIAVAREDEAERTVAFVFELTEAVPAAIFAASDVEAFNTLALVFALTAVMIEDDAATTSDLSDSDPADKVASVRLRVPYVQTSDAVMPDALVSVRVLFNHTSAASEPKVVSERAPEAQTASGIVDANDVDAERTVAFVLELIVVIAFEMLAASDVFTVAMFAARLVEAFETVAFVFALTAVVSAAIRAASDVDAARTVAFVFELTEAVSPVIAAARLVDAELTSDLSANDPADRVASVRFRVPYVHTSDAVIPAALVSVRVLFNHTSAASEPKVVSDRAPDDQTASGIVAARLVEAFNTVEFVFELIVVTAFEMLAESEVDALSTVLFVFVFTAAVPAVIFAESDVEAASTAEFVFALTEVVSAEMREASEDEADVTSD
jgi:hypothetical protein